MNGFVQVALAITTIALVSVVVVNGVNSAKVITSVGGAFDNSLSAAEKG